MCQEPFHIRFSYKHIVRDRSTIVHKINEMSDTIDKYVQRNL